MVERLVKVVFPLPIRKNFTYRANEALGELKSGARVLAPFGKRTLLGYIVDLEGEEIESAKDLQAILDDEPFFNEELFSFLKELADFYLAPPGIVLKNSYPSSLNPEPRKRYKLASENFSLKEDSPLYEIAQELKGGGKSYSTLKSKFKNIDKLLSKGISSGIVEVEETFVMTKRRLKEERVALLLSKDEIGQKIKEFHLSPKHLKLLEYLKKIEGIGFVRALDILKEVKVPHYTLSELAEMNFIEIFDNLPQKVIRREKDFILTDEQSNALNKILPYLKLNTHKTFLIYGVTGSGKTEIYLRLIEEVLKNGGSSIYLVPEISLASYLSKRLLERFGGNLAILHSAMSEKERCKQYMRIKKGEAKVVIGPRSALFSPLENIKLIVVDEEHDSSYRQIEPPFYNARDMAILRGSLLKIPVVLGSATPSIESFYNAVDTKKYELCVIKKRVQGAVLPSVEIVDMRELYKETKAKEVISKVLFDEIKNVLDKNEQVVILRNRLGYSTFVLCRQCGRTIKCKNCDIALTFHKKRNELRCHFCAHKEAIPQKCPHCGGDNLQFLGEGTEKIEDILKDRFPECRIGRMDRDIIVKQSQYEKLWSDFENKKIDILVGTQMISKGYHNPQVTLVGIISADFILSMPDFRCSERAFNLITQSAGRAGRGELKGKVVVQSYFPEHHAVKCALNQDFDTFYENEIKYRKLLNYPPTMALGKIEIKHRNEEKAYNLSLQSKSFLNDKFKSIARFLGPNPAPIQKLEGRFRFQILIKTETRTRLHKILSEFMQSSFSKEIGRTIFCFVDPANLM
jgi:primosomal protein N' (replication factor Y)